MILKFCYMTIGFLFFLSLISCQDSPSKPKENTPTLTQLYEAAVLDAMIADSSEISHKLIPILKNNEMLSWKNINGIDYVLAVTFAGDTSKFPHGETVELDWGVVWVSMNPELQNRIFEDDFSNDSIVSLRSHQLVGIPYFGKIECFIEFWVNPDDIFRHAPDNEITDNTAGIYFPSNASPEYIDWFYDLLVSSYYPSSGGSIKYPWTRLGYTYDWGNPENEFGVSEFVVYKGSKVIANGIYTPSEYMRK